MKDYAVIRIKGNQYKVSDGDEILVEGTYDQKARAETLLKVKNDKVIVGKPSISKLIPKLKVIENLKGKKIDVVKYRAKSPYRRKMGFRPVLTKLLVEKV
jgi:large subunit ribosomal protein L21